MQHLLDYPAVPTRPLERKWRPVREWSVYTCTYAYAGAVRGAT
eukprot:COSAG02_NODE_59458_length_274_cov_0.594286_1_plen_42_part_10